MCDGEHSALLKLSADGRLDDLIALGVDQDGDLAVEEGLEVFEAEVDRLRRSPWLGERLSDPLFRNQSVRFREGVLSRRSGMSMFVRRKWDR